MDRDSGKQHHLETSGSKIVLICSSSPDSLSSGVIVAIL